MFAYIQLSVGLILLIIGGEVLVKGAVECALRFRISKLVVGMTVVSFGTSAPELVVSLEAAYRGFPDIAIGNVIGSNIANLALVLGLTALVFPIAVSKNSIRFDWPVMMLVTVVFYLLILDGDLGFFEGAALLLILIIFNTFLIWKSRQENSIPEGLDDDVEDSGSPLWKSILFVVAGAGALAFGSEWLVEGAVEVAHRFGVSDLVISVTIVAFGTSAPELITSLMAAFRKHADISIGNLIGSNIYNIALVLGITGIFKPIDVSQSILNFDIYWVLGIAFIIFPFMLNKRKIFRWEGAILFIAYIVYIFWVVNLGKV